MIGKEEKSKGFTNQLVKIKIKTRGYYEIKICMGHTRTIFFDCI